MKMEAHLSADKKVEQLSEEELDCVLKQLTDHKTPESEKCPLVQRLNAENALAANDTSFSSLHQTAAASVRNDANRSTAKLLSRINVLSKDNEFQSSHRRNAPHSHCQDDKMNYAQSLQEELTTNYCDDVTLNMNSPTICGSNSNRKSNRANSFTMPFQSDNSDNINSNTLSNILDRKHLTNGGGLSSDIIDNYDHAHFDTDLVKSSLSSSTQASTPFVSNSTLSSLYSSNSSHSNGDKSDDQHQSAKNFQTLNFSSVHLCSISSLVDSINDNSAPNYQQILSQNKVPTGSNRQSFAVEEEEEEKIKFVEMKNLQRKANIIEYRSDLNLELKQKENYSNSKHCIDKVIDMPLISTNNPDDRYGPAYISNGTSSANFTPLYSSVNNLANGIPSIHNNSTYTNTNSNTLSNNINNNNRVRDKKKKRTQTEVKLAEQIEGHIGYKDVTYLESFVNNTNIVNGFDKKTKCKTLKPENETAKRPTKSSDKRNIEIKLLNDDKGSSNSNKLSASNSSSLSDDDMSCNRNDLTNKTTSLDPSNKIGLTNQKSKKKRNSNEKSVHNSSSDDFDAFDAEDYHEPGQAAIFNCLPQKSNSLLQSVPMPINDDEKNFYTVSDSEMADREKGFVTPKSKYFKKKRNQQSKRSRDNAFNKLNNQNNGNKPDEMNHSMGRGYESERESSVGNSNCVTSQTFSSSMHTINSKRNDTTIDYNQDNIQSDFNFLSNSDNMTFLGTASDLQNSGAKIPSYADIAKSYNVSPPTLSTQSTLSPIKSSEDTVEDFPQLSLTIESPTESSVHVDSEMINFTNTNVAINGDNQEENGYKLELKSTEKQFNKEEMNSSNFSISFKNKSSLKNKMNSLKMQHAPLTFDDNNSINDDDDLTQRFVFGYDSLNTCSSVCRNEVSATNKPNESSVVSGSPCELVFGFFNETESEMLKKNDNFSGVNFAKDIELDKTCINNDELNLSENGIQFEDEDFYKNAVHVNDLENHFRKLDTDLGSENTTTAGDSASSSNPKYSTCSTLSSSFDSSPVSSSSAQSSSTNPSAQTEPLIFTGCANKIKNWKFVDNVDEKSFNYSNIVFYVHRAWNLCMGL